MAKNAQVLIQELAGLSQSSLENDRSIRSKALNLAKELTATLSQPIDNAIDVIFMPHIASAVHTAVRMGLFENIAKVNMQDDDASVTTSQLAAEVQAEELLVNRILRLASSMGYVAEVGPDQWKSTPTTHAIANPAISAGHRFVWDVQAEGTIKAPQFLHETGWRSPVEPKDGFIQYAKRTKYDVFEYMAKVEPDRLRDFHLFMGNTMAGKTPWLSWYPAEEKIISGFDASQSKTMLVDVGGGRGHDLLEFARRFPKASEGQLVLQDIPAALDVIQEKDDRLTYISQDFFQPNVVKGARAYILHHILHDWSDKYALSILRHLRDAMTPGYSKLLILDLVLPNSGATRYQAVWDLCMMTFSCGIERSRLQWELLLKNAGLHLVGFHHGPDGEDADGIVEAVVR